MTIAVCDFTVSVVARKLLFSPCSSSRDQLHSGVKCQANLNDLPGCFKWVSFYFWPCFGRALIFGLLRDTVSLSAAT